MYCSDFTALCPRSCPAARATNELIISNVRREDAELESLEGTPECPKRRRKERPDAAV